MRLLLVFIVTTVAVTLTQGASPTCIKDDAACVDSLECCNGCCQDHKCNKQYSESCLRDLTKLGAGKGGPCENINPPCKPGYTCVLQQVQCGRPPCNPVPTCIPPDYHDYD